MYANGGKAEWEWKSLQQQEVEKPNKLFITNQQSLFFT